MMRRHSFNTGVCCCILVLVLAGTGLFQSWAAEVKPVLPAAPPPSSAAKPGTAAIPAIAPAPAPPYIYRVAGKSDPFQPFIETDPAVLKKMEMEQKKKATMKGRPISPLQQADIAQFRLAGIAGNNKKRVAIVEYVTTKKFYPLFEGTYIGTNEGRVAEIRADRVIVEERFEDQSRKSKKAQFIRTPIMLHKEEEEGKP
jgi:Tfp pilus assembly protein PilP